MTDLRAIPHPADNNPSLPPPDRWYKLVVFRCIPYVIPAILGLLMIIFLAIPALMSPEFRLDPVSSLSSLNISTSHVAAQWNIALSVKNPSKLVAVKYTHMKLILSFDGQLALSRPSLVPVFTQGPGNVTIVRAEALSKLTIINDLGVKGLVSRLKGGEVTIDVVAKAKRRLHLGLWWVPVFDVHASCMDVAFTAPTDSEDGGNWMVLGGTLSCTPDIFTQLWSGSNGNRIKPSWTNRSKIHGAPEEVGFVLLKDHLDRARLESVGMASMISLISD